MKAVLSLNAGSSSIKFALFKPRAQNALERVCRGAVEEIGAASLNQIVPTARRRASTIRAHFNLTAAAGGW